MTEFPLVSIIIVSYNSLDDLDDCLSSLRAIDYANFEIIIVDNASTDGSAIFVKNKFPWLKVIENHRNLGYGRGCNIGARYAQGDFLIFLNPDTRVDKKWLKELLSVTTSNKQIGACGSTILFWDGCAIHSLGGVYNPETGYSLDVGFGKGYNEHQLYGPRPFFHCCGVSLLVRAEAFRKVGGFATDYFLYFDEVDLCWRIRLLGYKIYSAPASVVYHKIDTVRAHSAKYRFFVERNSLQTIIKNYELKNLIKYGLLVIVLRICGCAFLAIKRKMKYSFAILRGFFHIIKNFKKIWCKRQSIQKARTIADRIIFKKHLIVSLPSLLQMFLTEVVPFLD